MVVNDHTALGRADAAGRIAAAANGFSCTARAVDWAAAVQVAAALGARVTAVASTPGRRAAATAAGAQQVYGPDGWLDAVRADGGVDVIVDPVGGDVFDRASAAWPRRGGC